MIYDTKPPLLLLIVADRPPAAADYHSAPHKASAPTAQYLALSPRITRSGPQLHKYSTYNLKVEQNILHIHSMHTLIWIYNKCNDY